MPKKTLKTSLQNIYRTIVRINQRQREYKPEAFIQDSHYHTFFPDEVLEKFRHRGDAATPPRWQFSFTAVTLRFHRGEREFSKYRKSFSACRN